MVPHEQLIGSGPPLVEFERDRGEPVPLAVSRALAAVEGVPITELPPLNDVIDVDALSVLLDSDTGVVSFTYEPYHVVTSADGRVAVYSPN